MEILEIIKILEILKITENLETLVETGTGSGSSRVPGRRMDKGVLVWQFPVSALVQLHHRVEQAFA